MKRVVLILLVVLFVATPLYAEVAQKKTEGKWCHRHNYEDEYYEPLNPFEAGVGVDLEVYEFDDEANFLDSINIEGRKDFIESERGSVYVVLKMKLSSLFKK